MEPGDRQKDRNQAKRTPSGGAVSVLRWGNIRTGDLEKRTESGGINTPLLDVLNWRGLLDMQAEAGCSSLKFKGDTGAKDNTFKVISIYDIKL